MDTKHVQFIRTELGFINSMRLKYAKTAGNTLVTHSDLYPTLAALGVIAPWRMQVYQAFYRRVRAH